MENDKQRNDQQPAGEQNPTLNAPGSQVSDYGNVSGGSGNDDADKSKRPTDQADRSNVEPLRGDAETAGNP